MILLIIGIMIIVLFFVFKKLIKRIFRVLFYIGVVIVIFLGIAVFSNNIGSGGVLNTIGTGANTVVNNSITGGVEGYLTSGAQRVTKNIITFAENKTESGISNLFSSEFGIKGIFNGTNSENNEETTLEQYKNSNIYGKEIFQNGDNYAYVNGILCERIVGATDTYSIYEANINGYNYKPVGNFNNNFSGFSIGSNSITIDGITYYRGLGYNKIDIYGESYGTKDGALESVKKNKIKYAKSDKEVYINNLEYSLGNGRNEIKIDGQIYNLRSGVDAELKDYLNINGFIYWKSKDSNSSSITINGDNYICENSSFLSSLL